MKFVLKPYLLCERKLIKHKKKLIKKFYLLIAERANEFDGRILKWRVDNEKRGVEGNEGKRDLDLHCHGTCYYL